MSRQKALIYFSIDYIIITNFDLELVAWYPYFIRLWYTQQVIAVAQTNVFPATRTEIVSYIKSHSSYLGQILREISVVKDYWIGPFT